MPLKWFICPDNTRIEIDQCLSEGGCRLGQRCAFRSYLQLASKQRPWTGKPSTTQLIKGTMQAFLEIKHDYAVSPDERAFMINGTRGHVALESSGESDECSLLEFRFDGENINETGIADIIEIENGKSILGDNKVSGSYKVQKALGFEVKQEETGDVYQNGKKKGQSKTRKVLVRNINKQDMLDWELQLNKYRIEAENQGAKIDEQRIQCIVRDGNTYMARSRGVFRNVYNFKVPIWPDKIVLDYFEKKRNDLFRALKQGYWNVICSREENWDGLRCQKYCSVAEFCSYGKYLKQEKETEDMAIKGLSDVRRLPRIGKIRLGVKNKNKDGKEYPVEIDYFKLDPQTPVPAENSRLIEIFTKKYGEQPKSIPIMFPVGNTDVVFPVFYKRYGLSTGLVCKGDGEKAFAVDEKASAGLKVINKNGMIEVECKGKECPYYIDKKCSECGTLQILLPELPGAGVWQITTGSYNSIVNLNSCMDYICALAGRIHMIPLTLERRMQEVQYDGKKTKHYILHISMNVPLSELQRLAQVDPTKALLELPPIEEEKEDILTAENKIPAELLPVKKEINDLEKVKSECEKLSKDYAIAFDEIAKKTPLSQESWREAKVDFAKKVCMVSEIHSPTTLSADQWKRLIKICKEESDTVESNISLFIDKIS